jgi:hypothetical protein
LIACAGHKVVFFIFGDIFRVFVIAKPGQLEIFLV